MEQWKIIAFFGVFMFQDFLETWQLYILHHVRIPLQTL